MGNMKVTPMTLWQMKEKGDKHTLIPVYDYPFARILDECGVELLLVGDSLGKQVLGRKDFLSVSVDEMIYHTQAVVRATKRALVITDMPFMSYEVNIDEAKRNAGRIIKEGGADAVKLEGGIEVVETIAALVKAGIPVMGHIGPVSQSAHPGIPQVRGSTKAKTHGGVHARTAVRTYRAAIVTAGIVNGAVQHIFLGLVALLDFRQTADLIDPLQYQLDHVDIVGRRRVVQRVFLDVRRVAQNLGQTRFLLGGKIRIHDDYRHTGRADVLLRTGIDQREFGDVDLARKDVG